MNSDLFFDNKKYISLKSASTLTGYSRDYVGQLCRDKKVESKRVGASWFVSEESILSFQAKKYIPCKEASKLTKYTTDYIGQLCRSGKIDCKKIGNSWYVAKDSILNYKNSPVKSEQILSLPAPKQLPVKPSIFALANLQDKKISPWFFTKRLLVTFTTVFLLLVVQSGMAYRQLSLRYPAEKQVATIALSDVNSLEDTGVFVYEKVNSWLDNFLFSPFADFWGTRPSVANLPVQYKKTIVATTTPKPSLVPAPAKSPIVQIPPSASSAPAAKTIIERVVEKQAPGVTFADLDSRLEALNNKILSQVSLQFASLSTGSSNSITNVYREIAQSQRIDELTRVHLIDPRITGGTITDASISGSSLSGTTGSFSGTLMVFSTTTLQDLVVLGNTNLQNATTTSLFTDIFHATNGTIDNLTIGSGSLSSLNIINSTTTNATSTNAVITNLLVSNSTTTNATVTNLVSTNATSTNFFATLGNFTNLFATNFTGTNSTLTNLTATNATSSVLYVSSLFAGPITSTSTALFGTTTITNLSVTNTSTSTFAGGLTVGNNAGFVINQSAPANSLYIASSGNVGIGTAQPTQNFSVAGNSFFSGGLGIGVATTTSGAFQTSAGVGVGGNLTVGGNTVLGTDATSKLVINASLHSNIVPDQNITYDLGSPSFFWRNVYVDTLTANSISAGSSAISGTTGSNFTINSDNATSDTEDSTLIFFRGLVTPNALLSWNSTINRFEFNQPAFIQNADTTNNSTTLSLKGTVGQTADVFSVASSSGSSLFNVTSAGNVGISSSTPGFKLTVGGNGYFDGGTVTAANLVATSSFSAPSLTISAASPNSILSTNATGQVVATSSITTNFIWATSTTATNYFAGNVGIGTTVPAATLNVGTKTTSALGDVSTIAQFGGSSSGGTVVGLSLVNSATGAVNNATALSFHNGNNYSAVGQILSNTDSLSSPLQASLRFLTYDSTGNANLTEKMRITGSGNVGIGTTSPFRKLSVQGDGIFTGGDVTASTFTATSSISAPTLSITGSTTLVNASSTLLTVSQSAWLATNGGNVGIGTANPAGLFDVNGKLTVLSGGNVGIGTTAPTELLTVTGTGTGMSGTAVTTFSTQQSVSPRRGILLGYDSSGQIGTISGASAGAASNIAFWTYSGSAWGERMRIDGAGNIGIGTTASQALLHIYSSTGVSASGQEVLRLSGSTAAGTIGSGPYINFTDTSNVSLGNIRSYTESAGVVGLSVGTLSGGSVTERLHITGGGNLGIGTTTPQALLALPDGTTAAGGIKLGSDVSLYRTAAGAFSIDGSSIASPYSLGCVSGAICTLTNSGGNASLTMTDGGSTVKLSFNGRWVGTGTNVDFNVKTNNATVATFSTSGNLGIGTTSPFRKLSVQGDGIFTGGDVTASTFTATSSISAPTLSITGSTTLVNASTTLLTVSQSAWLATSGGNVGIGTTATNNKLEVAGNIGVAKNVIKFGTSGSEDTGLSWVAANTLGVGTGAAANNGGYMMANGFVSRDGTTSGIDFNYNNGAAFDLGSAVTFRWGTGNNNGTKDLYLSRGAANTLLVSSDGTTGSANLVVTGNVGIGTTSPSQKLDVAGSAYISSNLFVGGAITATSTLNVTGQTTLTYASTTNIGSTGSAYFATTGGNVGIGTTTPAMKLSILNGTVAQHPVWNSQDIFLLDGGNLQPIQQFIAPSTSGSWIEFSQSGASATRFLGGIHYDNSLNAISLHTNSTEQLTILTTGKTGIGSTTPFARLSVKGLTTSTGINFQTTDSNNLPLFSILDTGNVGIGTTSPFRTFAVQGSGIFTGGDVTASTLTATSSLTINGGTALTTTNQTGTGSIVMSASPTLTGTAILANASTTALSVSSALSINGKATTTSSGAFSTISTGTFGGLLTGSAGLSVTGDSTFAGNLLPSGSRTVGTAGNPWNNIFTTTITASSTTVDAITSSGNLVVNGNTTLGDATSTDITYFNSRIADSLVPNIDNALDIGDGTNWLRWRTGYFGTSVGIAGTATSTGTQLTTSGSYLIDSAGTLSINTTNNQPVTFGTGKLTFTNASTTALSASSSLTVGGFATTTSIGNISTLGTLTISGLATFTQASTTNIGSTGSAYFATSGGNVGIGTSTPFGTLAVNAAGGQPAFIVGSSTATSFIVDKNGSVGIGTANTAFSSNATVHLTINGSSASNFGDFGIGTNQSGTSNFVGQMAFFNSTIAGADKRISALLGATDGATNSGNLQFYTWNAGVAGERMRISAAGNVGIGSTNPAYKLDVTGTANISSTLNVTGLATFTQASTTNIGSTGSAYFATAGGNVGISSTTPAALFSVGGDGYFTGNVGIGISTPTSKLDIRSSGGATSAITAAGGIAKYIATSNSASHYGDFSAFNDQGDEAFIAMLGSTYAGYGGTATRMANFGSSRSILFTSGGTVAFKATNGTTDQAITAGAATFSSTLNVTGQTTLTYASTTNIGSTGSAYFATSGGNVGIGTTSPFRTLAVQGSGIFTGGDVTASTLTATSSISAPVLTITGLTTLGNASTTALSVSSSLAVGGFATTTSVGNISTLGTLTVSGATTLSSTLGVTGLTTLTNASTTALSISSSLSINGNATTTSTGAFSTISTGTFGGLLTANAGLSVTGNSTFAGNLLPSGSRSIGVTGNPWTSIFGTTLDLGGTATSTGTQLTTSGAYTIDSAGTLSINTTNNQSVTFGTGKLTFTNASTTALSASSSLTIGGFATTTSIGNISTLGTLTVGGATTLSSTLNVAGQTTLTYASTTNVGSSGSAYFATSGGNVGIGTANPSGLFDVNGKLTVLSGGNVGIGTTTPSTRFSVGGAAGDTSGHGYFTGGLGVGVVNTTAGTLQTTGNAVIGGSLTVNGALTSSITTGQIQFLALPTGTLIDQGSVYINPASAGTNNVLLGLAVNGTEKARIDAEGDVQIIGTFNSTNTSGTNALSGGLSVNGNTTLGDSSSDTVTLTARVGSSIVPTLDTGFDLGSPSLRWNNIYAGTTTISNLIAGGTASSTFIINSDNGTNDAEDSMLQFSRGTAGTNPQLKWNATLKQLEFNAYPVSFAGAIGVSGTATSTIAGPLVLSATPNGTALSQGSLYINPSSGATDNTLFGAGINGVERFRVDAEGDTTIQASLGIQNALYNISLDTVTIDDKLQINGNAIKDSTGTTRIAIGSTNTLTGNLDVGPGTITSGNINGQTISSSANFTGTLTVAGVTTLSNLTANRLVATDGSSNLVSTISAANLLSSVSGTTGTGNLVFSASPTFTGTAGFVNTTNSGTLSVTGQTTLTYASTTNISSTGSAYFATTGGNVGIGSTSPFTALSVQGSGYFSGGLTTGTVVATSSLSINGGTALTTTNQTGTGSIVMSASPTLTGIVTLANASTTALSASSSLTVGGFATTTSVGNISTLGMLTVSGATTLSSTLGVTGLVTLGNASTTALSVSSSLTVGGFSTTTSIGNISTLGTLSVTGHTTFEGITSTGATGSGKLVYDTSPTISGLILTGLTTLGNASTTALSVSSSLTVGGFATTTSVGNISTLGTLTVSGATTLSSTLGVTGLTTLTNASTTALSISSSLSINGNATTTSTGAFSTISTGTFGGLLTASNGLTVSAGVVTLPAASISDAALSSNVALLNRASQTFSGALNIFNNASTTALSASNSLTVGGFATTTSAGNISTLGTLSVTGHTTFEGITSTGATGTGKLVYDTSPTISGLTLTGVTTLGNASTTALSVSSSLTVGGFATTTSTGNISTLGTLTVSGVATLSSTLGVTGLATFAQASTTNIGSTGSAYFATSGGGVGIGTVSPSALLHIKGTFGTSPQLILDNAAAGDRTYMQFNDNGANKAEIGLSNTANQIISGAAAGDLNIRSDAKNILFSTDSGTTVQMYLKNGGNVGIGTTSPFRKLSVQGDAIFTGGDVTASTLTATSSLSINGGTALTTTNQTGTGSIVMSASPTLTGVVTLANASTTALSASSSLTVGGFATTTSAGNISTLGTLAVTGHTTFEGITSTGATGSGKLVYDTSPTISGLILTGVTTLANASTTALSVSSSLTIGGFATTTSVGNISTLGTLTVSGATTLSSTLGVTGLATFTQASTTNISSTGSSYFATTGGNVGIATTSPFGMFSINPVNLAVGAPEFVIGSSTMTHFNVAQSGLVTVAQDGKLDGELQIRSAVAGRYLHIASNGSTATFTAVGPQDAKYGAEGNATVRFFNNGTNLWDLVAVNGEFFPHVDNTYDFGDATHRIRAAYFGTASTTNVDSTGSAYFATSGGSVGIATTSPSALLALNSTGGQAQFTIGSSTATSFTVDKSGYVGVGKGNPSQPVDILSTPKAALQWKFNDPTAHVGYLYSSSDGVGISDSTNDTGEHVFVNPTLHSIDLQISNQATALNLTSNLFKPGTDNAVALGDNTHRFASLNVLNINNGASGQVTFGGNISTGGSVLSGGDVRTIPTGIIYWNTRSVMASPSDGVITISNNAASDFNRLQFGGTTSSFPAIKRSSATLAFRLADDSADAGITASSGVFSTTLNVTGLSTLTNASTTAVSVSSALTIGGFATTTSVGNISTLGTLSVTGHTTFEGITSTGATGSGKLVYDTSPTISGLILTGVTTLTNASTTALSVSSSLTIGGFATTTSVGNISTLGTLTVSGATTLSSTLNVTGQTTLTNASTTAIGSTGSAYFATSGGNVGVGTTSPVALLSLGNGTGSAGTTAALGINFGDPTANLYRSAAGTLKSDGQIQTTSYLQSGAGFFVLSKAGLTSPSNGIIQLVNNNQSDFTRLQFGGSTNAFPALARVGANLVIQDANGTFATNLGIGTTTPGDKLSVLGAISVNTGSAGEFIFRDANTNFKGSVGYDATADALQLKAGGNSTKVTITSGGNVGIGTTSPFRTFSVQGSGIFTGGDITASTLTATSSISIGGGTALTTSNQTGTGSIVMSASPTLTGTAILANASTTALSVSSSLTVGGFATTTSVGNISTLGTLSVTGHTTFEGITSTGATGSGKLVYDTSPTISGLTLTGLTTLTYASTTAISSTGSAYFATSGGNVGIGTTTPVAQMQIYGAGQTTSALTDAGVKTATLDLASSLTSANSGGALTFSSVSNNGSLPFAAIKGLLQNGNNNGRGDLAFSLRTANTDTALTEYMRIQGTTGNIGIGTSSPASLLSVAGNGYFTGNIGIGVSAPAQKLHITSGSTSDVKIRLDTIGAADIIGVNNSGDMYMNTNSVANVLYLANGGNIGISTTTPSRKLDVYGSGQSDGVYSVVESSGDAAFRIQSGTASTYAFQQFANGATGSWEIGSDNANNFYIQNTFNAGSGGSEFYINRSTGNVGIGTTSPLRTFAVQGSAIFTGGDVTASTFTATSSVSIGGGTALTTSNQTGTGSIVMSASPTLTGTAILANASTTALSASSSLTVGGFATTTSVGNISTLGTLSVTGHTTFEGITSTGATGSGKLVYDTSPTISGLTITGLTTLGNASTTALSASSSLTVGGFATTTSIGNISTLGTLTVSGATTLSSTLNVTGLATFTQASTTNIGSTGSAYFATSGGNVGIGTTTPIAKLDVFTNTNQDGLFFEGNNDNLGLSLQNYGTGGRRYDIYTTSGNSGAGQGKLAFYDRTANAYRMQIDSTGNVGIGTTTPTAKLNTFGSGYNFKWGSVDGSSVNHIGGLYSAGNVQIGSVSNDPLQFFTNDASAQITLQTTGKVGIGTTTPNNMLDIYSTTKSAIGFSGAADSTYKWTIGMDTTNAGRFSIASSSALGTTDRFVIDGNGNVGIGTASPSGLFDVNGKLTVLSGGNVGIGTTSPFRKLSVQGDAIFTGGDVTASTLTATSSISIGGGTALTTSNQTGTGSIVMSASPTLTGKATIANASTTAESISSSLTVGGFATTTSVGAFSGTNLTDSALTSGRVTFAGTAGLLQDDLDLTFSGDTLTATKLIGSTNLVINSGTALTTTNQTGTGSIVMSASPTLTGTAILANASTTALSVSSSLTINGNATTTSTGAFSTISTGTFGGLLTAQNGLTVSAGAVTLPAASISDAALSSNVALLNRASQTFSGALNIFNNASTTALSVSNSLTVGGFATTTSVGNISTLGTLSVSGATTLSSTLGVTGLATLGNASTTAESISSSLSIGGKATTTSTGAFSTISTGIFGGLVTGSAGLAVTGDSTFTGNLLPSGSRSVGVTGNPWANIFGTTLDLGGTATSTGTAFTTSGAYTLNSAGALSINTTNNQPVTFGTGKLIFTNASTTALSVSSSLSINGFATTTSAGNISTLGTLSVTGHTTFEGITSTGATGTGKLVYDTSPTITGIATFANASTTNIGSTGSAYFATTGGNVGIGTATPGFKLQVSGGDTRIAGTGAEQSLFGLDKVVGFNDLRFYTDDTGTTERFRITANGGLSLGSTYVTTDPGAGNMILSGNLGVGTTSPAFKLDVAGAGYISSNLFVGGAITATSTLNVTGLSTFTQASTTNIGSTGSAYFATSGGNVGIGTTSPFRKLSVQGDAIFTGGNVTASTFTATSTLTVSGLTSLTYASTTAISSTGSAYFATSGGNVGIGTSAPTTKLEVVDSSEASTTPIYITNNGNATSSTYAKLGFRAVDAFSVATTTAAIGTILQQNYVTGKADLAFSTLNSGILSEALRIVSNGNVGIGTASPNALLEISKNTGTATIDPASIRITTTNDDQDWDTTTSWGNLDFYSMDSSGPGPGVKARVGVIDTTGTGRLENMILSVDDGFGTLTERMRLDYLGNVGIGTASAIAKLDVEEGGGSQLRLGFDVSNYASFTVDSSGNLDIAATGSANTVTLQNYLVAIQSGTATSPVFSNFTLNAGMFFPGTDELAFDAGDAERMRIDANGNVGVATTSPWQTFSVEGGVSFHGLAMGAGNGALCLSTGGLVSYQAAAACTTSSQRFKNNINTLSPESGLAEIMAMRPVSFRYNQGAGDEGVAEQVGFIAEEMEGIDSRLVVYDENHDPYSVQYQNITSILAKAVQQIVGVIDIRNAIGTSTPAATVTADLNIGIGTTTPSSKLHVFSNVSGGGVATFQDQNATCVIDPTNAGLICSSDQNLKKDITALNATTTLDKLMQLRPVEYRWKGESSAHGTHTGFIAQEVEQVFPEFVSTDTSGRKAVAYTNFVPVIIQAVQQINGKVADIDSRLTNLEQLVADSNASSGQGIFSHITTWLADSMNGITNVVASVFNAREKICVDGECLNKTDIHNLLSLVHMANASSTPEGDGQQGGEGSGETLEDTSAPVITVTEPNPTTITVDSTYVDIGATVTDTNADGSINNNLGLHFTVDGAPMETVQIDTTATSTHTIIYSAVDGAGNWGFATRTVEVIE